MTTASAPVTTAVSAPLATSGRTITVSSTGFSAGAQTRLPTAPGVVAVDPSVIPLGTRMTIPATARRSRA